MARKSAHFSFSLTHPKCEASREVAAEAKRGKIDSGMPNGEAPKPHLGVHACPVFLEKGDE